MSDCDYAEDNEEPPWECYLCGREDDFDAAPYGWLKEMHPLCKRCANTLLHDKKHKWHYLLSYHYKIGEIMEWQCLASGMNE